MIYSNEFKALPANDAHPMSRRVTGFPLHGRPGRDTVWDMANLLRRGHTWFARLHIPADRWADVGRALGAKSGVKRELVRTLGTNDYREALRRRDPALAAMREEIDQALRRARLRPLTDWTVDWQRRAVERREEMRQHGHKVVASFAVETPDGEVAFAEETADSFIADTIAEEAEEVGRRQGYTAARKFQQIALGRGLSIAQAAREWLAGEEGRVRGSTIALHMATLARFADYLSRQEGLAAEGVGLEVVTRRMAGEFVECRAAEAAAATVKREASTFNGLWRWAIRRGHVEANPWSDQTASLQEPRGTRERGYTADELVKLLRAGQGELAPHRGGYAATLWDVIRIALLTGGRLEEVLSLRVCDVIEGGAAIAVAASERGGKTEAASRIIPLHAHAQRVVRARMANLGDPEGAVPLFPEVPAQGPDGRRAKTIASRFTPIRRRILGDSDEVDFHSLRRSFLTAAETALHHGGRVTPELIALLAGHKRGGLAFDLYSDWSRLGRGRMAGRLGERLGVLSAAVDDIVALGLPEAVRAALAETADNRPQMVRLAPAFRRVARAPKVGPKRALR